MSKAQDADIPLSILVDGKVHVGRYRVEKDNGTEFVHVNSQYSAEKTGAVVGGDPKETAEQLLEDAVWEWPDLKRIKRASATRRNRP